MAKNTKIVGIDVGNLTTVAVSETKTFVCDSRVKKVESHLDDFNKNEKFTFEGEKYLADSGSFENDILKYTKENYLSLLYYSIAKVTNPDENNVEIVLCLPMSQFKTKKDSMMEYIKENNKKTIVLDGKKRTITISNVFIVPESYSLKTLKVVIDKLQKSCETYVIDIGGGTIDVSKFNGEMNLIDGKSIQLGLIHLYQTCREYINISYDINITLEEAKLIFNGEKRLLNDEFKNKKDIVKRFLIAVINELKTIDNLKISNICLTGGGANILYPTFSKLYPQTILLDDITLQCQGMYKIGEKVFNK